MWKHGVIQIKCIIFITIKLTDFDYNVNMVFRSTPDASASFYSTHTYLKLYIVGTELTCLTEIDMHLLECELSCC